MPGLTASQLLELWDAGQGLHPLDRAVLLATAALPQRRWDDVADLAVGTRDAAILGLRQATVGDRLSASVQCPACGVSCEFELSVRALLQQGDATSGEAAQEMGMEFRLPSSRDLAAATRASAQDAERLLVERCAVANATSAPASDPIAAAERLSEWITRYDPLAEIELTLHCQDCQHGFCEVLDPPALFWQEIDARARSLLDQVDRLARVYGWNEAEVLSLSDARRAAYLERAG